MQWGTQLPNPYLPTLTMPPRLNQTKSLSPRLSLIYFISFIMRKSTVNCTDIISKHVKKEPTVSRTLGLLKIDDKAV